jgi:acetoacetyl-CoA synthetase
MERPVWNPSPERVAAANLTRFIATVNERWKLGIDDYAGLHAFSVEQPERFWLAVWDFCGVRSEQRGERVLEDGDRMPGARWFPQARLNFAENLLWRDDDATAVIGLSEDGGRRVLTFPELRALVSRLARAMRESGVGVGDRVAGYTPNIPEAVAAMLAAASIGAIWSCCSPELGVEAVVDRLEQIAPALLVTADGYRYGGRTFPLLDKAAAIAGRISSIRRTVVVPVLASEPGLALLGDACTFGQFIAPYGATPIAFARLPFDHPVFVLFSSGTTGRAKCIVHGAGGAILENLKAHALQFDVKPDDCVYWWTATGWVVWNFMIFALGRGASIVLYDGSPTYPTTDAILRHAAAERATFVRLTPGYVDLLTKAQCTPSRTLDFGALRTMIVASSPFGASGYDYIHENVKRDVHLASPSGGTDPLASLVSANPVGPVFAGEIQAAALGLATRVFDEAGNSVVGKAGELVVCRPFPSLPIGFFGDPGGERFRDTYFRPYPNVWRHGDWAQMTERGGFVIFGRSDATLNARGIRIGTAEIYHQLAGMPEIVASVAVAQDWEGDTRVVLFVQLPPEIHLDQALDEGIRARIRENLSPRHVPARIVAVPDIPRTTTGKVSEIAVHSAIHGRPVRNRDALANPESLEHFAPQQLPGIAP